MINSDAGAVIRTETSSNTLPPDDPDRLRLADEVHARPSEAVETPSRISWIAIRMEPHARASELRQLHKLCDAFGIPPPAAEAVHFSAGRDDLRLRWERHGEFSSFQFQIQGQSSIAFRDGPIDRLPAGWLSTLPGMTVFAAHALVIPAEKHVPDSGALNVFFAGNTPVGSEIGGGAAWVFTDFKVHADRFSRFVVFDRHLTARQAGRTLQRLFEIETYRMLALLSLPMARSLAPAITDTEQLLALLTGRIASGTGSDEELLADLTRLAAQLEHELARAQGRFGATRAYRDLVATRIAELREQRIPGVQPIAEFMARRFGPATATIASVEQRLQLLSERVAQVSTLLSTRVNIAHEEQNRALLASLNQRAEVQLHLQLAVESLSVAAITYYAAGLVAYLAKSVKAAGIGLNVDILVGLSVPVILVIAIWAMRRAHRRISLLFQQRKRPPDV